MRNLITRQIQKKPTHTQTHWRCLFRKYFHHWGALHALQRRTLLHLSSPELCVGKRTRTACMPTYAFNFPRSCCSVQSNKTHKSPTRINTTELYGIAVSPWRWALRLGRFMHDVVNMDCALCSVGWVGVEHTRTHFNPG